MKNILFEKSDFHNPEIALGNKTKCKKVQDYLSNFVLCKESLLKIKDEFLKEMKLGFAKNPSKKSSLLMMNTYISKYLDGSENGDFLSIDLGSTNFRVCHLKLDSSSNEENFHLKYYNISKDLKTGTEKMLFEYLANCVKDFLDNEVNIDKTRVVPFGFTFSFPFTQLSINSGLLNTWAKTYNIKSMLNRDPAEILQQEFNKLNLNIKIVALINDSTGTLMKGIYLNSKCKIGAILGTGFNICYMENNLERIHKWTEERLNKYSLVKSVAIDTECGGFGDTGIIDFIKTDIDFKVDDSSLFPKSYSFEKLVSGKYLGEICQRIIKKLIQLDLIFNGQTTKEIENMETFTSNFISLIENDETDHFTIQLIDALGYKNFSKDDISIIKYICKIVSIRCAALVSCIFATIIEWIDEEEIVIAIDGSLYKNHPHLNELLRDFTNQLTNNKKKIDFILADDGSGKGGCIVAAIADNLNKLS